MLDGMASTQIVVNGTCLAPGYNCLKNICMLYFWFCFLFFFIPVHSLERVVVSDHRGTVRRLCCSR